MMGSGLTENRICFISLSAYGYFDSDTPAGGGAERQLHLLSQELKSVFDVHFIVGDYGQQQTTTREGVVLHRAYEPDSTSGPTGQIAKFGKLAAAMERANADVYIHRGDPKKAIVTSLLARGMRAAWVFNVANDANLDGQIGARASTIQPVYRWRLRHADAIVAQTDYQQRRLEERFGVASTVVPNGYVGGCSPVPAEERGHVLWIGRIDGQQKQPMVFLDIAERVPEVKFRMIGTQDDDTELYAQVERRATELDNVDFLGRVPPTEVEQHYRSAIALVNTSAFEGFPNTFLEAWRCGTPVISLTVDPNRYLPRGQSEGFADGDLQALEEAVRAFARQPDLVRKVGTHSRRQFSDHFLIDTVAERYASVLEQVLD